MKTEEIHVRFQPSGRSVFVLPGTKILEAAGRAGIILQTPCGGQGTCGKCRVRVVGGSCSSGAGEPKALSRKLWDQGCRLACQTAVDGESVIEVPAESTFETSQRILVGDSGAKARFNPVIRKRHFKLAQPAGGDPRSEVSRLVAALGNSVALSPALTELLPGFLRLHDWQGTAVLAGRRLIALEGGDTSRAACGAAFDVGTTTVVGTLFDLVDGRELGVASRMNPQIAFGDDVISRIRRVRENKGALAELQRGILETVNDIITAITGEAGVDVENVYEVTIAGNTTMQQILCGFDPSPLGEVPFVHAFDRAQTLSARRLGIRAHAEAEVYVFPQIGGFVGGDTVAGMLAARLDQWHKPVMLVDIGTNGEIVLAYDGKLLATSTAAGPAFEGARITQGMRAAAGAVEKVLIQGDEVLLNVIGNTKPAGLCGTALIDAAAEMLRHGLLDPTGRILRADEAPAAAPVKLRERLVGRDHETHFLLASGDETATHEPLLLWQRDIREMQLATGAIRAGIQILLRRVGLKAEDLDAILLAGAFGNFIRRNNARRMGLLPRIPCERIRFIGNAASLGAKLALLAEEERDYAERLRQRTEHVDLSLDPEFQDEFITAMMFPEDGDRDGCE